MQLVDQQIFQLTDVLNHVEEYRRPANLTADQAAHVAETFNQINTLATDVSNPRKAAAAQGELTKLYADLNTYAAVAPVTPVTPTTPTPTPPAASNEVRELQGQFNGLKEQIRALNEQFKAAYGTGNRAAIADLGPALKSPQDAQGVLASSN
jgi:outer membrane murein-binding lipoprotein Lpp